MADTKHYLDLAGLQHYDEKIKGWVNSSITNLDYTEENAAAGKFVSKVDEADGVIAPVLTEFVTAINNDASNNLIAPTTKAVYDYVKGQISDAGLAGEDAISIADGSVKLVINENEKALSQDENGLKTTLGLAWDAENQKIQLTGVDSSVIAELDASHFVLDGMLDSVAYSETEGKEDTLVFSWNTAAGKTATEIDLAKYLNAEALADINSSITRLNTSVSGIETEIGNKAVAESSEGAGDGVEASGIYKYVDTAVAEAKAAATTVVAASEDASSAAHLEVASAVDAGTGATTYTVKAVDVASEAALAALNASVGTFADASTASTVNGRIAAIDAKIDEEIAAFVPVTDASIDALFA